MGRAEANPRAAIDALWPKLSTPSGLAYFAKGHRGVTGGWAKSPDHFERIVRNLDGAAFNTYVHLNTSNHANRYKGSLVDIRTWHRIFVDLDPVDKSPNPSAAARAILRCLPRETATHIYTGNGHQLWIEVESTPIQNLAHAREIERAMRGYVQWLGAQIDPCGCHIDVGCCDLSRVARMPGTTNQKKGRQAKLLAVATRTLDTRIVFEHTLPPQSIEPAPRVDTPSEWRAIWPHLTEIADRFMMEGIGKGGRHHAAYATARRFRELGVPQQQTLKWLWVGAQRCRPTLSLSDVEYISRSAYERQEES